MSLIAAANGDKEGPHGWHERKGSLMGEHEFTVSRVRTFYGKVTSVREENFMFSMKFRHFFMFERLTTISYVVHCSRLTAKKPFLYSTVVSSSQRILLFFDARSRSAYHSYPPFYGSRHRLISGRLEQAGGVTGIMPCESRITLQALYLVVFVANSLLLWLTFFPSNGIGSATRGTSLVRSAFTRMASASRNATAADDHPEWSKRAWNRSSVLGDPFDVKKSLMFVLARSGC